MIELAAALEIVKDITAIILLAMQSASPEQRVVLVERHIVMTKPFYDLIDKISHAMIRPVPATSPALTTGLDQMPTPGLRPVLPAPVALPKP